jgi:hypothetical protein
VGKGGDWLPFMGRFQRWHNQQLIQGETIPHLASQGQMTAVYRIKGAAEDTDGLHVDTLPS